MTAPAALLDRTAWLQWRRGGIGASDVPAILGLSKWASPWSVWAEKSGLLPLDDDASDYAEFGWRAEAMIGPWFADLTGLHIAGEQTWCSHTTNDWMRCTVDGFVTEAEVSTIADALGVHEIKTRNPGRRWDEIPADIEAQVRWQMVVTDAPRAWLSVLHGRRLEIYELVRDDLDEQYIVGEVTRFWHDNVLAGVAPPIDGHDATLRALAAIYPSSVPGKTIDIDDVAGALPMLREAKAARREAEAKENAAKAVLTWAMGDAAIGTVHGDKAVTLGTQTRKTTCTECGHVEESDPFRVLRTTKELS